MGLEFWWYKWVLVFFFYIYIFLKYHIFNLKKKKFEEMYIIMLYLLLPKLKNFGLRLLEIFTFENFNDFNIESKNYFTY